MRPTAFPLVLLAGARLAAADPTPTTPPAAAPGALDAADEAFLTREPEADFLVAQRDLAFAEIPQAAGELIPLLDAEVKRLGLRAVGALVFVYVAPAEPAPGRVRLQISQPIALEGALPTVAAPFVVRHAPARRYLCILHRGPIAGIGDRWQALGRVVAERGLTRQDEAREVYLRWEAPDSPRDLVLLEEGVGPAEPTEGAAPARGDDGF